MSGIQQDIAVALVPTTERSGSTDLVHGVPMVVHAVRGLLQAGCVRHVVVTAPEPRVAETSAALAEIPAVTVVPGGPNRTDSVRIALHAALAEVPEARIVLIHDVTRPFTPPDLVRSVVAAVAEGVAAVVPVLPVADTVKLVDAAGMITETLSRADLRVAQSPQGFAVDVIRDGRDVPLRTVPGHVAAMAITTPFDLTVAEAVRLG